MTIDKKREIKLQHDINRAAAKIFILSSVEIDRYEYLMVEEIFPSKKDLIKQQDNLTSSPLGKTLEKQQKQLKSIE